MCLKLCGMHAIGSRKPERHQACRAHGHVSQVKEAKAATDERSDLMIILLMVHGRRNLVELNRVL